jgi:hypothetical protein
MELHGYSQQFAAAHPETGEVSQGIYLTGEKARALGAVFVDKILDLSQKLELTEREANFLNQVVDHTAQIIIYSVEQKQMNLPETAKQTAALIYENPDITREELPRQPPSATQYDRAGALPVVATVAGGAATRIAEHPEHQAAVSKVGFSLLSLFGAMITENGGLVTDDNLTESLQNMMMHYELIDSGGHK